MNDDSPPDCLLLDLETSGSGRLLKIGAVSGERSFLRSGDFNRSEALSELDAFAAGSRCVAGHNILDHDLPVLAEKRNDLAILGLPVIDTLFLSPLCFPENPYHRLVKDYKLVSESVNDPVGDARLAGELLRDEIGSLRGMAENAPEVFRCLRRLVCGGSRGEDRLARGMEIVFNAAAGTAVCADKELVPLLRSLLAGMACRTSAMSLGEDDVAGPEKRWALAYVLAWLRVSGANSVLPPWVRLRNPWVCPLLDRLRETPCDEPECGYCRDVQNPQRQLKRYFGFDCFRPTPADAAGESLQAGITLAGMRNESHLAIMPTGGGKSLCFQLPALVRNYRRGHLTIAVSPLQALMKDQVDGLERRTGMHNAAALYGLLTPPERGQVLRGVRSGAVALLYVSPEQLRSSAFRKAVLQREIGCWVVDEAHCLSKWGHDFRPDYLYIGRFIREIAKAQGVPRPAIACFTATAKQDVVAEIIEFFRRETGAELARYQAGVERDNLKFEVQTIGAHGKLPRINDILRERLAPENGGSAIVFRATRSDAEETAMFLSEQCGWRAAKFHAGMSASEKKSVQDAFLAGDIRVICATNAFGMGIDKEDVRLVIHGDTPGSLENYLQEAGRAGRDRAPANCILLYDEEDCEKQFRIGAFSELSREDIVQILRGLKKAARRRGEDEVVITSGELLRDEEVEVGFDIADASADTKVRTAISWLERSGFVERNENRVNVIQARLLLDSMAEVENKLARLNLSATESELWLAIIREIMNAPQTEPISTDEIAGLPEFQAYMKQSGGKTQGGGRAHGSSQEYLSAKIFKILDSMAVSGILKKDTLLTAFIRHKTADHSGVRLQRVDAAEREFLNLLREHAPDPEGWLPLNLRPLNHELQERGVESSVEMLRNLLRSLSEDGRGFSGQSGSLEIRFSARDSYRVRLRRNWDAIGDLAGKRRRAAALILGALLESVPAGTPPKADLLVEFSFEKLADALNSDLALRSELRDIQAAIERALMFMHEQNVIILQKGLAIFRSAMTVRVLPEAVKQRYTQDHYESLQHHYRERIFQVHVMNEYARYGLNKIKAALDLVVAYFTMDKESFITRFFGGRQNLLEMATTARSFRAIVDALGNRDQIRIVTSPVSENLLILAGPGAGKTKTVVHRCAYLLRVKRVRPRSILVCCFNHKAALQLRRRLAELAGKDALGVTIQTYHGLALRILGRSPERMADNGNAEPDFDGMIADAISVLRGDTAVPGVEPDETRDRLLAGFEHILVDEYQDIDAPQYEMISAIAGRTAGEGDRKLSILAVGDDDQSIYGFRGANTEFIRKFSDDYDAKSAFLTENYRSTRHIVEAANIIIAHNRDRMKKDKPIRIDQGRTLLPPGGPFGAGDQITRGRVAVVEVRDAPAQAAAIIREIRRLKELGARQWQDIAVLSRTRRDLAFVRAAAEAEGIPVSWPLERKRIPPLHRIREIRRGLEMLAERGSASARASELTAALDLEAGENQANPWTALMGEIMSSWADETGDEPTPVKCCVEYIHDSLAQRGRDEQAGRGVVLNTVHAAKGTEYPHVLLCGDWSAARNNPEEERRVLYVGMTRARDTLSIFIRADKTNPFAHEFIGPCFAPRREAAPPAGPETAEKDYVFLGLEDFFLDFAGRHSPGHPIHKALAETAAGSRLVAALKGERVMLLNEQCLEIALMSAAASAEWRDKLPLIESIRIVGMAARRGEDCREPEFQPLLRSDFWEVPVCEMTIARPSSA